MVVTFEDSAGMVAVFENVLYISKGIDDGTVMLAIAEEWTGERKYEFVGIKEDTTLKIVKA